jgi:hypothetical protein
MLLMIAYFDTQTFNQIYGRIGCTGAEIANLRKAIYGRQLTIRLSIHTLEEILLARKVSPQAFAAQLKLTLSLASARALIKPCQQLVFDDVRSYGARGEADQPFLRGDLQNTIADGIAALIESDGEDLDEDFVAVLDDARRQKQQFLALLDDIRQKVGDPEPVSQAASSPADLERVSLTAAEKLTERVGSLESCRQRGLDGLLRMKSVRMTLGAAESETHSHASHSDSAAIHHVVSAAAVAETFVSGDGGHQALLARIPLDGFTVCTLRDFLTRIA